MDYISYLQSLSSEDWQKPATGKWTVKDVLSHLVGWEREVALTFMNTWKTKQDPWFIVNEDYDSFNDKVQAEFADWKPSDLLQEWKKWQDNLNNQIKEVDEDEFNVRRNNLSWMTDEGEHSHTDWHINQIKKAVQY
jgi:uncharacterized protein (TIGR03083 family)